MWVRDGAGWAGYTSLLTYAYVVVTDFLERGSFFLAYLVSKHCCGLSMFPQVGGSCVPEKKMRSRGAPLVNISFPVQVYLQSSESHLLLLWCVAIPFSNSLTNYLLEVLWGHIAFPAPNPTPVCRNKTLWDGGVICFTCCYMVPFPWRWALLNFLPLHCLRCHQLPVWSLSQGSSSLCEGRIQSNGISASTTNETYTF